MDFEGLDEGFQTQVSTPACDAALLRNPGASGWLAVEGPPGVAASLRERLGAERPQKRKPHHPTIPHHKRVPHQRRTQPKLENDKACSNIENQPLVRSEREFHGWNQLDEPVPTVHLAIRSDKNSRAHKGKGVLGPYKIKNPGKNHICSQRENRSCHVYHNDEERYVGTLKCCHMKQNILFPTQVSELSSDISLLCKPSVKEVA
jgi:hypothetical protein